VPATPLSLNAEPRADAAFPGCIVETSQETSGFWLGWPLAPDVCGSKASATPPSVQHTTIANMVINLVFIPVQSERRRFADRTAKVTTLLLLQIIRPYRTGDRSCYFIMTGTITSLKHPRV